TASPLIVTPGQAASFDVTGPASVDPGVPFSITVTPVDKYGNVTFYSGTLNLSTNDPHGSVPSSFFAYGVDGSFTISGLKLNTPGSQTISLADQAQPSIKGSVSVPVS